ncbi:hypothetical protein FEM33_23520 [Dyadobacter flavalbus]|uniref:Uncharacterized protein n=1 Tax=Dyadobacter flavalbus TaxID=2579942 RepID=A0A5M8QCK4_9BACT|nr:hypothetical protein [Dyadobacter flavalbus]KAA6432694.1 hypothetical protein FEM33_23520 [Dyadobacter flavalbus]
MLASSGRCNSLKRPVFYYPAAWLILNHVQAFLEFSRVRSVAHFRSNAVSVSLVFTPFYNPELNHPDAAKIRR